MKSEKLNNDISIQRRALLAPKMALQEAFRGNSREQDLASTLFEMHPRALCIALGLCDYLTHAIPFAIPNTLRTALMHPADQPVASLLTKCLSTGLQGWKSGNETLVDFLTGAFLHLPQVAKWQVYVGRGSSAKTWDFCDGSLAKWMTTHSVSPMVIPRTHFIEPTIDPAVIRTIVSSRILDNQDFQLLDFNLNKIVSEGELA